MLSAGDSLQLQWHVYPESEGWKLIFQADRNQKRAGAVIFISDKMAMSQNL